MKSISAYYLFYYISLASLFPYLSIYFSDKGITPTVIGAIFSIAAIVGLVSQPVLGILNDRLSDNRKILFVSTIASPVIALGYYFFDGYVALVAVSILLPIFQTPSGPISDAIAVEAGKKEGFSFGSVRLWGAFGFAFGSLLTGFMYGKIGYDKSFFFYCAINALVLVTLFRLPRTEKKQIKLSISSQIKRVFVNKPFMIFVGISFLLMVAAAINFNFLPIYFKESGYNKSWIGTAYAIAAIIEVPMFWISTKLNEKIGRFYVLCIAALVFAAKCLVLSFSPNMYVVLAMQLFDGIYFAFFAGAAVETVESFSTTETNATYQTVFAAITSGLGSIIGNPAGGIVIDHLGVAPLYFYLFLLSFVSSVCFAAFSLAYRKHNHTVQQSM